MVSAAAAGVAPASDHHAGGVGSTSPPGAVACEGALQDTPDYIRRGAARHRVAPLELFSAVTSPPPAEDAASAESRGVSRAGGARQAETVGGAPSGLEMLQAEEVIHIPQHQNFSAWKLVVLYVPQQTCGVSCRANLVAVAS